MKQIKQLFRSISFWIIAVELIIAAVLWKYGFRITYDPSLDNNWNAIGATAEWVSVIVGAIIVPFSILYIQHKWEKDKDEIALSNDAMLRELSAFRDKYEPLLTALDSGKLILNCGDTSGHDTRSQTDMKEQILQYLIVNMGASVKEVASRFGIPMASANRYINQMVGEGIIESTETRRMHIYKATKS